MTKQLTSAQQKAVEALNTKLRNQWADYLKAKSVWGDKEPTRNSKAELSFEIGSGISKATIRALVAKGVLIIHEKYQSKVCDSKRYNYGRNVVHNTHYQTVTRYKLNPDYITN